MNVRVKLSSKGQVVIPKSVRDAHGWKEGTELEVVDAGQGGVTLHPVQEYDPRFPPATWEEFLASRIKIDRPFPTDEKIEETMLAEAVRRFDAATRR
ncbi:AbrB/MazE/SpoVT family DNA-binding domain-containing protein [Chelativorans alearense]|uniref:AbrB/MazE/SpoVT family DNA-binding domain-containing protein n=1 Tax=Chelativorans alearense TaxID=2681495 RepID=UPI0013D0BB73|nr:AbrB/MazE/SpoVT family DNA-binding domain-containing protein [Chelativorans alearense]